LHKVCKFRRSKRKISRSTSNQFSSRVRRLLLDSNPLETRVSIMLSNRQEKGSTLALFFPSRRPASIARDAREIKDGKGCGKFNFPFTRVFTSHTHSEKVPRRWRKASGWCGVRINEHISSRGKLLLAEKTLFKKRFFSRRPLCVET
jgi:hypothetical protein